MPTAHLPHLVEAGTWPKRRMRAPRSRRHHFPVRPRRRRTGAAVEVSRKQRTRPPSLVHPVTSHRNLRPSQSSISVAMDCPPSVIMSASSGRAARASVSDGRAARPSLLVEPEESHIAWPAATRLGHHRPTTGIAVTSKDYRPCSSGRPSRHSLDGADVMNGRSRLRSMKAFRRTSLTRRERHHRSRSRGRRSGDDNRFGRNHPKAPSLTYSRHD